MRTVFGAMLTLLIPVGAAGQACYGFPVQPNVSPVLGYEHQGDTDAAVLGVAGVGLNDNTALRITYARSRVASEVAGAQGPTGNGFRIALAATPGFAKGALCVVSGFRVESWRPEDGASFRVWEYSIGPSIGHFAGDGQMSVRMFVAPQLLFVGGRRASGGRLRETRWAVQAGLGASAGRGFLRLTGTKIGDVDELRLGAALGIWLR